MAHLSMAQERLARLRSVSSSIVLRSHRFLEYQPWKGDIERRTNGSLIAIESGTAYAYAAFLDS